MFLSHGSIRGSSGSCAVGLEGWSPWILWTWFWVLGVPFKLLDHSHSHSKRRVDKELRWPASDAGTRQLLFICRCSAVCCQLAWGEESSDRKRGFLVQPVDVL